MIDVSCRENSCVVRGLSTAWLEAGEPGAPVEVPTAAQTRLSAAPSPLVRLQEHLALNQQAS